MFSAICQQFDVPPNPLAWFLSIDCFINNDPIWQPILLLHRLRGSRIPDGNDVNVYAGNVDRIQGLIARVIKCSPFRFYKYLQSWQIFIYFFLGFSIVSRTQALLSRTQKHLPLRPKIQGTENMDCIFFLSLLLKVKSWTQLKKKTTHTRYYRQHLNKQLIMLKVDNPTLFFVWIWSCPRVLLIYYVVPVTHPTSTNTAHTHYST